MSTSAFHRSRHVPRSCSSTTGRVSAREVRAVIATARRIAVPVAPTGVQLHALATTTPPAVVICPVTPGMGTVTTAQASGPPGAESALNAGVLHTKTSTVST